MKDFKLKHGDKYDYSKVEYINAKTKICIICPVHGEFWQNPNNHRYGYGCKLCGNDLSSKNSRRTQLSVISEFNERHSEKYDYSKVEYNGMLGYVTIICKIHGDFLQTPDNHRYGIGCPRCGDKNTSDKLKFSQEQVIKDFKKIHGNKYNYSKVKYEENHKDVIIVCAIHGEFNQRPSNHKMGKGCKKCGDKIGGIGFYIPKIAEKNKDIWLNIDTIVYICKLYDDNESFYKIGITTKEVVERFYRIP